MWVGRFRLLLRPLAAPVWSATSSARWCTTAHVGLGSFGWWHDATAERLVALAATMLASWSGHQPVVGCTGFGGGGNGCFFRCICVLTDASYVGWALFWLRQVGRHLWASRDGLGCCWWAGTWPVGTVRTMCSASPCWEAIPDPICVLTLLLCRLQACCRCTDGRGSRAHVRDGFDERGDGILGVAGVRRQRFRFGEWCPAGARAVGGCCG